jgi:hypothetical protein
MGYYKFKPVIVIPSASLKEFNAILERHGYGPGTLAATDDNAVIGKASAKTAAATHYVLEAVADAGFLAAVKLAFETVNGKVAAKDKGVFDTGMRGKDDKTRVNEVLDKAGKKTKVDRVEPVKDVKVK